MTETNIIHTVNNAVQKTAAKTIETGAVREEGMDEINVDLQNNSYIPVEVV